MPSTYVVSKRGPKGEPLAIKCESHEGCKWEAGLVGPKRDDDPIFVALYARHLRDSVENRSVTGHLRRPRM